jgi:hypothetical protein
MRIARALAGVLLVLLGGVARAADPELTVTPIVRDGQLQVSFVLNEGMTSDLRDAIQSGLATSLSYDLELRRDAASWFDQTLASVTITASVRFDNLTRRYQLSRSFDGRVEDARPTENDDEVRQWLTEFDRVPLAATSALEPNGEYYIRVRVVARPRNTWFPWPWERASVTGQAKFTFIP